MVDRSSDLTLTSNREVCLQKLLGPFSMKELVKRVIWLKRLVRGKDDTNSWGRHKILNVKQGKSTDNLQIFLTSSGGPNNQSAGVWAVLDVPPARSFKGSIPVSQKLDRGHPKWMIISLPTKSIPLKNTLTGELICLPFHDPAYLRAQIVRRTQIKELPMPIDPKMTNLVQNGPSFLVMVKDRMDVNLPFFYIRKGPNIRSKIITEAEPHEILNGQWERVGLD